MKNDITHYTTPYSICHIYIYKKKKKQCLNTLKQMRCSFEQSYIVRCTDLLKSVSQMQNKMSY